MSVCHREGDLCAESAIGIAQLGGAVWAGGKQQVYKLKDALGQLDKYVDLVSARPPTCAAAGWCTAGGTAG
jgi:hypothetical protein